MSLRLKTITLFFILSWTILAHAQAPQQWETVVFDGEQLIIIHSDLTLNTIKIPNPMLQIIDPILYNPMILSDDNRYFVAVTNPDRQKFSGYTITIADLHNQTCCITVKDPFGGGLLDIILGVFDDAGQYFTATIGYGLPDGTRDAIIIVDVETGEVVYQVDPKEYFDGARFVEFIDWDEIGIRLVPWKESEPYMYDFIDTNAVIWKPDTNEFQIDENHFDGFDGDFLHATGEYLRWVRPENDSEVNIIEVISNGQVENAKVIFDFTHGEYLPHPRWVLDGQAYIMRQEGDAGIIIFRNGRVLDIDFEIYTQFIAGTPDGWLLQQSRPPEDRTLYHFTVIDNEIEITPLITFDRILTMVRRPQLGKTVIEFDQWIVAD